jgi:hypothetical protein
MLIHAGDFTFFSRRPSMIADFDAWLGEHGFRSRIVVPGNHEFVVETGTVPNLKNATLLINRGVVSLGLKIWGSPITPHDGGAFGRSNPVDRCKIYGKIPADTDILITHGPPFGILDGDPHSGCMELRKCVDVIRPKLHVFGHAHSGYGVARIGRTIYANAAMLTELGNVDRTPLVFSFPHL